MGWGRGIGLFDPLTGGNRGLSQFPKGFKEGVGTDEELEEDKYP